MKDDDLYSRHHTLSALLSVLLHDLRNPLHSATLLVEAMGSPTADVEALRGRLRLQFGKLEALMAEAAGPIKELALDPRVEVIALDALLRSLVERYPALGAPEARFTVPSVPDLMISVDPTLFVRAAIEIAATIAGQESERDEGVVPKIVLSVDQPDAETVRLRVGDLEASLSEAMIKTPFAITGGGIRLAVARALTQNAGATLRLEPSKEGPSRFAFLLRRAS
jgi:signal transduction histidine kinase